MPHECTQCNKRFPDGSKEMLNGCPGCGGKKFQFIPKSGMQDEDRAQRTARREVADTSTVPDRFDQGEAGEEESSSASAAETSRSPTTDLAELRERLDSQFESIRIVEPGQYELNLMELYDRDTYVISLQEDGRYVIDVPEAWRQAPND